MRPSPIPAAPGQESVWEYPRPPRVEPSQRRVEVRYGDLLIADTQNSLRVLETSLAPSYYLPPDQVALEYLRPAERQSWCEWKGAATYYDLMVDGKLISSAAWSYQNPTADFTLIKEHLSFYPGLVECFLDGEQVRPQAGGFYGGWISSDLVGPFKGEPDSQGW